MKRTPCKLRTLSLVLLACALLFISFSCKKKIDIIPMSDYFAYPSVTGKNFNTELIDSGIIELKMRAPLVEKYDNTSDPYTEFKEGIHVEFYDGKETPIGTVTAKYAKYLQNENLWELKDSVIVINENRDMLETEVLFWDQGKDLIYTDRFVRITNEDQIMMGTGFESDSKMTKRRIRKPSATITLKDE